LNINTFATESKADGANYRASNNSQLFWRNLYIQKQWKNVL